MLISWLRRQLGRSRLARRSRELRAFPSEYSRPGLCAVSSPAWPTTSGQQAHADGWPRGFELRDQDERAWYRVFYLKKIAGVVYVWHCFGKADGANRRKDIEVAKEGSNGSMNRSGKERRQTRRSQDEGKRSL